MDHDIKHWKKIAIVLSMLVSDDVNLNETL